MTQIFNRSNLISSILFFLIGFLGMGCHANKETVQDIYVSPDIDGPVSISIEKNAIENSTLVKEINGKVTVVPTQYDDGELYFNHSSSDSYVKYFLRKSKAEISRNKLSQSKVNGDLSVLRDGKSVVTYRYGMTYPPEGIDSSYGKSGYIHPLITPGGDTLTRIQPPDHYHHYGIWGPWTHTQINGQRVDFWNIGGKKGTVLFKEFKSSQTGDIFSEFVAAQEHIDFITEDEPQVALNEDLEIKIWNLPDPNRYMVDYTSSFTSPLEGGILFEQYRYGGGLGFRFTERWKADNCEVLTSEGHERVTADGTSARWCLVQGESTDGNGMSGILFLSNLRNRFHPEPMRVWPLNGNGGRGDMFFEFCPIRHEEWKIEKDEINQLEYRMVVFDGSLSAAEAEAYWQAYANPPKAVLDNETKIIKFK